MILVAVVVAAVAGEDAAFVERKSAEGKTVVAVHLPLTAAVEQRVVASAASQC